MLIAKRLILLVLAAAVATPVAAQRNVRPVRPNVTLPEGPVRNVILKSCTACHGIDEYACIAVRLDAAHDVGDRVDRADHVRAMGEEYPARFIAE